jgi:hypothetical protein
LEFAGAVEWFFAVEKERCDLFEFKFAVAAEFAGKAPLIEAKKTTIAAKGGSESKMVWFLSHLEFNRLNIAKLIASLTRP